MTSRPNEFELIARYFAPLAEGFPGAFGLTDDAATVDPGAGFSLVATADAMLAGIHFLPDDPPDTIGRKLLRVNLSDLAAMGAEPICYLVTIALPSDWTETWIAAFADGLMRDQDEFGVALAGGDTVASPGPLALSLTALGRVETGGALRRAGARAGDRIWVSGTVGDAALGLRVLKGELDDLPAAARETLTDRFRLPRPRVSLGRKLRGIASAAIDVSDGLIGDLGHICEASNAGASIDAAEIPLSDAARSAVESGFTTPAELACGGDDFELLFTAPAGTESAILVISKELGLALTPIGTIEAGGEVRLIGPGGTPISVPSGGFRHF